MENKIEFLLRRASEESLKAIASDQPLAADAHDGLALRYSAKAIIALANCDEPIPARKDEQPDRPVPRHPA